MLLFHHRAHTHTDGVLGEDTVYVGIDEVGIVGHVQTGVHGVGLGTTVLLVHHAQLLILLAVGDKHALEGFGDDALLVEIGHFDEVKLLDHLLQRAVLATVVDDDDLKLGPVLREQRLHVVHDGVFLVVGGSHDRHTGGIGRVVEYLLHVDIAQGVARAARLSERQSHQHHVAEHQRHRVEEDEISVGV